MAARRAEAMDKNYPILPELEPRAIEKFLMDFETYESRVKKSYGLKHADIAKCIKIEALTELRNNHSVDVNDWEGIKNKLETIAGVDRAARQVQIIQSISLISYENKGNLTDNMRRFIKKVDQIISGMTLESSTQKELCKAVVWRLPSEFMVGGNPTLACSHRQWTKWATMKQDLALDAVDLSRFQWDKNPHLKAPDIDNNK
jgi:hypothetical protein